LVCWGRYPSVSLVGQKSIAKLSSRKKGGGGNLYGKKKKERGVVDLSYESFPVGRKKRNTQVYILTVP